MNEWKKWITKCVTNKLKWCFHTHNWWHRVCLSICLSHCFSSSFKTLNYFLLTFSFADAVLRCYSAIKIIPYLLLDIQVKNPFYRFRNTKYLFLTAFRVPFQTFVSAIKKNSSLFYKGCFKLPQFLSVLPRIILRDQTELIKYEAISIRYYQVLSVFLHTLYRKAQPIISLLYCIIIRTEL